MYIKRTFNQIIAFSLAFTWTLNGSTVLAHGGGGDMALFTTDGQVDVGFAVLDDNDIEQVFFDPNDRVFSSVLVPQVLFGFSMGSTEPGFDADEGLLPVDATITVSTTSLQYWNGTGSVAFADAQDVTGRYEPATMQADSSGGFHAHPLFGLSGNLSDGVYLAELQVGATGLADSDPFYLVTLVDDVIASHPDAETAGEELGELVRSYLEDASQLPNFGGKDFAFYGDAISYVETQVVPEPTGNWVLVACMFGLLAVRRSKRIN